MRQKLVTRTAMCSLLTLLGAFFVRDGLNPTPSAATGAPTAAVYTVGIGSPTCGTYRQLCDPMSCNPNELDTSLLTDIAKSPGYSRIVEDASTLPDIYGEMSLEMADISVNLSGHKYSDMDCDGTAGSNPPLGDVPIKLLQLPGGTLAGETTTDAGGVFSFQNVPAGTYAICEDLSVLPGRTQTLPMLVSGTGSHPPYGVCYERTVTAEGNISGLDFYNCVRPAPPAVGGIAELPDVAQSASAATSVGGSSSAPYAAIVGAAAAGLLAFGAAGWYARRRWPQ